MKRVATSRRRIGNTIALRETVTPWTLGWMPFKSDSLPTNSRQEFCLALKSSRERKGIGLAEIEATTKIPASLFTAFERNDLRRWPKGLYRRSFFRDYARAIGVPVPEACAAFGRLFPDDEGAARTKAMRAAQVDEQAADVRLMLDAAWHGPRPSVLSRLIAPPIDAGAVILMSVGLAWVAGIDRFTATAIVALAYFSVATALVGESPAKWALARRPSIVDALRRGPGAIAAVWRRGADAIAHVSAGAEGDMARAAARSRR